MLVRELCEFMALRRGAREVASHQFEHGRVHRPIRARANMGEARAPRFSLADQGNRPPDIAQRPQREREVAELPRRPGPGRTGTPDRRLAPVGTR